MPGDPGGLLSKIIFYNDSQCKGTLVDGTKGSPLTLDMSPTCALSSDGDNFAIIYLRRLIGKLADDDYDDDDGNRDS